MSSSRWDRWVGDQLAQVRSAGRWRSTRVFDAGGPAGHLARSGDLGGERGLSATRSVASAAKMLLFSMNFACFRLLDCRKLEMRRWAVFTYGRMKSAVKTDLLASSSSEGTVVMMSLSVAIESPYLAAGPVPRFSSAQNAVPASS